MTSNLTTFIVSTKEMTRKSLIFAVVATLTLFSCTENQQKTLSEGGEIAEKAWEVDVQDPEQLGECLKRALETNEGEVLKARIDEAREWSKNMLSEGKGEEAKGIIDKLQSFLCENTDKAYSVIGDSLYVQELNEWVRGFNADDMMNKTSVFKEVGELSERTTVNSEGRSKVAGATRHNGNSDKVNVSDDAGEKIHEKTAKKTNDLKREPSASNYELEYDASGKTIGSESHDSNNNGDAVSQGIEKVNDMFNSHRSSDFKQE